MTTENQLAQLDRDAKALKTQIDLGTALDKLRSNRDFNKLIVEGYLKDEAIRLVQAKGNPALQKPEHQAAIIRDIDAIGSLCNFFTTISQQAAIAGKQLNDLEDERVELLSEAQNG